MALPKTRVSITSEINVTPLVDVMLVLLIIFMVVTPLLQNGVPVQLAPAHNPNKMQDADREDAVLVSITHDGAIYLKNQRVSPDEITDKVKDLMTNKLDKTAYVRADGRALYKSVVTVVDAVRAAGVDNVGMLTEQVDQYGHIIRGASGGGR